MTVTTADNISELAGREPAHKLDSPQVDALTSLGYVYLQHKQFARAITLFTGLRKLAPGNVNYLGSLGYAHIQAGQYDKALELVQPYLNRDDERIRVLRLIAARALLGLKRHDEARQQLAMLSARRPGAVNA